MYASRECSATIPTLAHTKSLNSSGESIESFLARSARLLIAPMLANASSRNYKEKNRRVLRYIFP